MHCLANFCYVCLEKKDKLLSNINSSLSVHNDIIHIIGYLPFNLAWLKTLQIVLICEECCLRLRDIYQFQEKCLKNSSLLQSYRDNLNTSPISNKENVAELLVKLNIIRNKTNAEKCEIQSENEGIYTLQSQPTIEGMENVPVKFKDSLIKEEIICKEEVDDKPDNNSTEVIEDTENMFDEYPMDDNFTEIIDNESKPEISINDNTPVTNTDCVSSEQAQTANKNDLNTAPKKAYKCSTCNKSFIRKSYLNRHTRTHTDEKPFECAICNKRFRQQAHLVLHVRTHTGEKPFECSNCKICFTQSSHLLSHMRVHTGEKPFVCSNCKKCFTNRSHLVRHMLIHTGEKPYECSKCKKSFTQQPHLQRHLQIHKGEKPHS